MEPVAPPQSEFPGRIDRQCFQPESASESYRQSGRLRGVPGAGRRPPGGKPAVGTSAGVGEASS